MGAQSVGAWWGKQGGEGGARGAGTFCLWTPRSLDSFAKQSQNIWVLAPAVGILAAAAPAQSRGTELRAKQKKEREL